MQPSLFPETSRAAFNALGDMPEKHGEKILAALEKLGEGTGEKIAQVAKLTQHQVQRRLKELEIADKVYKPGNKLPTTTGRPAYTYKLKPGCISHSLTKIIEDE